MAPRMNHINKFNKLSACQKKNLAPGFFKDIEVLKLNITVNQVRQLRYIYNLAIDKNLSTKQLSTLYQLSNDILKLDRIESFLDSNIEIYSESELVDEYFHDAMDSVIDGYLKNCRSITVVPSRYFICNDCYFLSYTSDDCDEHYFDILQVMFSIGLKPELTEKYKEFKYGVVGHMLAKNKHGFNTFRQFINLDNLNKFIVSYKPDIGTKILQNSTYIESLLDIDINDDNIYESEHQLKMQIEQLKRQNDKLKIENAMLVKDLKYKDLELKCKNIETELAITRITNNLL